MTWDKTKPAGATKIRLSDEEIRENNDCLEDALGRDHEFPGTKGSTAGKHNVIQFVDQAGDEAAAASDVKIWNNGGVLKIVIPGGTAEPLGVEAGTKAWFYQNTAPTGWTIDSTPADALLAVKGGSQAFNVDGGNQAGTWTQPGHVHSTSTHRHTGPSHAHTTAAHTLTVSEIPGHTHNVGGASRASGFAGGSVISAGSSSDAVSSSTGGGGAHNHGDTGEAGTGFTNYAGGENTGSNYTANTWRPLAQVGIICAKD